MRVSSLSLAEGLRLDVRLVSLSVTTCPPTVRLQCLYRPSTLRVVVGYKKRDPAKSVFFVFYRILDLASTMLICGSHYLVSCRLFMG